MAQTTIPALSQWNTIAGGTSVLDNRGGYDTRIGNMTFTISARPGKRTGYSVWVWGAPPHYSHHNIAAHVRSPQQGVAEAKRFLQTLVVKNPLPSTRPTPCSIRRLANGKFEVRI